MYRPCVPGLCLPCVFCLPLTRSSLLSGTEAHCYSLVAIGLSSLESSLLLLEMRLPM